MRVSRQLEDWPERKQRQGRWWDLDEAAGLVSDPGLAEILIDFVKASG